MKGNRAILTADEMKEYLTKKNSYLLSNIEDIEKSGKGSTQNSFEQLNHNIKLLKQYE